MGKLHVDLNRGLRLTVAQLIFEVFGTIKTLKPKDFNYREIVMQTEFTKVRAVK